MNSRGRTRLQTMKSLVDNQKNQVEILETKVRDGTAKATTSGRVSSRERKIALQKDIDKLKKKLKQEENVQRALKRAFTRPLGALPRLPPFLPPYMLELLAEVAVLEEEIFRLEQQVVHFRKKLYCDAVFMSSSTKMKDNSSASREPKQVESQLLVQNSAISTTNSPSVSDDCLGKENQCRVNSTKNNRESRTPRLHTVTISGKKPSLNYTSAIKNLNSKKLDSEWVTEQEEIDDCPNKLSEEILKCLSSILLRLSSSKEKGALLTPTNQDGYQEAKYHDPYGILSKFGTRDIGPYKNLRVIESRLINPKRTASSMFLFSRLRLLLRKLASANLKNLTHQEKLAFWINIHNSCMMNAYLEHGIPETPEMVIVLMQKGTVLVGGHLLNAITIEHFILRLPYHSQYTFSKSANNDEKTIRSMFGLELSEPLVTFALSCGSWSSPAVKVYTASEVENQLEVAKRDYLQAAVGISPEKFGIPKMLEWYLLDFAKDLESLLDWLCLQLPNELEKEAISRIDGDPLFLSQFVEVIPYDFSFRLEIVVVENKWGGPALDGEPAKPCWGARTKLKAESDSSRTKRSTVSL